MVHSEDCVKFVAGFEGLRTKAYRDQGGILTIGYGHINGVKEGDTCTELEAQAWLDADLLVADKAVHRLATVPLSQNQYDALISLVFNIGAGNFAKSTILDKLISGDYDAAAKAWTDPKTVFDKVNGEVSMGLFRRRQAERDLFLQI
jgi:GH24 family phage-related lysozyme (muramidase)